MQSTHAVVQVKKRRPGALISVFPKDGESGIPVAVVLAELLMRNANATSHSALKKETIIMKRDEKCGRFFGRIKHSGKSRPKPLEGVSFGLVLSGWLRLKTATLM